MNLDFIFEHIPILKQLLDFSSCHNFETYILVLRQLLDFSSCRIFGTYPGFETITGIHINVNFQVFTHLWNKTRFYDKVKYNKSKFCFELRIIHQETICGILHQEYLKMRVKKVNIFKDIKLEIFNTIETFFRFTKFDISFMP